MVQGSYVTDETIGKVDDEVWSDESVQYIAKGSGNVVESFQGSTTKHASTKGWPRIVATNQRVFIKTPQFTGSTVESVDYQDLTAADIGSSGLTGTEMKLRTFRGKTYTFNADEPGDAELEEMMNYIRKQISNDQPAEESTSSTDSASANRADLHKADSCVECGESVNEGVSRCSNCGYDPADYKEKFRKNFLIGTVLCSTVIGIPLGILYLRRAFKQAGKAKKGVTG
jgi:hypothetical protein